MGHDKLRKFAENETFSCLLQPSAQELLADGYFHLRDHAVKGHWAQFFAGLRYSQIADVAGDCFERSEVGISRPARSRDFAESKVGKGLEGRRGLGGYAPVSEGSRTGTVLELGCGKGEYTVALAERDLERNYVGVDIKGARLWKGAKYATEHRLPNVAFLRTRVEFITAFFAPGEVSEVWLTFSDPQYRSENSRLCSPLFLERYRSFMRPGGIVHLKTDSRFLHEYALAVCRANNLQILCNTVDLYGQQVDVQPVVREVQTFYEQLFLEQGYPITYLSFVIDHEGAYVSPRDPEDFDAKAWRAAEGPRLLFGHDSAETRRQKLHAGGQGE